MHARHGRRLHADPRSSASAWARASLDELPPEQVERIEVLRAPRPSTAPAAVAGTINVVLREAYRRRL